MDVEAGSELEFGLRLADIQDQRQIFDDALLIALNADGDVKVGSAWLVRVFHLERQIQVRIMERALKHQIVLVAVGDQRFEDEHVVGAERVLRVERQVHACFPTGLLHQGQTALDAQNLSGSESGHATDGYLSGERLPGESD